LYQSPIQHILKQADAKDVLTKPDLAEGACKRFWKDRLREEGKFGHGHFAVRLSGPTERGMADVDAGHNETDFFRRVEWKYTIPQDRLGVENLAKYLSYELSAIIEKRLFHHGIAKLLSFLDCQKFGSICGQNKRS